MLNQTEAARQAQQKMDERFVAMQAIHKRMDQVRATGERVPYALYAEWEAAYQQFQRAHDDWKQLASFKTAE
jgi:hypothetical protein